MAAPNVSLCADWIAEDDLCAPCSSYSVDATLQAQAITAASEILYNLSGRQFSGLCTDTVRPCSRSVADRGNVPQSVTSEWGRAYPYASACSCQRGRECGCARLDEITLGGYPVVEVSEVRIDGAVLDSARYRVDDYRWLVRLNDADGTNPGWPCCQDMALATTEEDTWSVTFDYGREPPESGKLAASVLACELILGCQPETLNQCRLPRRVTQVTRQGVAFVLSDPGSQNAVRSLPEVALFLDAFNPHGLTRQAAWISPDIGPRVRRAGT